MTKRKINEVLSIVSPSKKVKGKENTEVKHAVDADPWELLAESMEDCEKLEEENHNLKQQIHSLTIRLAQAHGVHCSVVINKF